ncbi:hypothetical protein CRUP_003011 [Coryphaenoides rupestris]|nr:hypothetical protein CRUP_003011 [Coryphaenoides rupestris]
MKLEPPTPTRKWLRPPVCYPWRVNLSAEMQLSGSGLRWECHDSGALRRSPMDEEGVHDSFNQLIAEQSQNESLSDTAFELQELQRELDEEGQDYVSPTTPEMEVRRPLRRGRRDQDREAEAEADPLIAGKWSSATLRVLSSMPSRTIGRSRGAIISQYYNRTMQLRMLRHSRPSIRDLPHSSRPSLRGYRMASESAESDSADSVKRDHLVNNLQDLSVSERVRMLRAMPLSVAEKSELRQAWYSWLSFLHSLQLWQVALKRVGGRFGTGVLSYFLFLKTLLFFNLFLFLVTGLFLVLPQAVHPPEPPAQGPPNFSGLELLTGGGAELGRGLSYNMPLAYFLTIGTAFFTTCIILVYSMSKSFGQSFRIDKSHGMLAMKVFCSWDFKVIKKSSVALMSENISTQLKELLADANHNHVNKTLGQRLWRMTVHGLAWTICLGSTVACALGVDYLADHNAQVKCMDLQSRAHLGTTDPLLSEARLLALPVGVSLINLLLPGLFNAAAWMEEYDSPSMRTSVAISRNLMLKVSVLGVLCFHWLGREAMESQSLQCWESFVGQELYRFLLMDFVFTVLDTLFGEFLWRLFAEKVLKRNRRPVFDIARNVLELIYGQTLAWLGVLFSPLLPGVQIIKLLLLFYIKMGSVMLNCQAPRKPIIPSKSCGPFRGLNTMMQAGRRWVEQLEQDNSDLAWLATAHSYLVENPLFLFVSAGVFLIIIYFHMQVVGGQRKIIDLLQEQIVNEGEDKKFLITRLQSIHERKREHPPPPQQQPGFAQTVAEDTALPSWAHRGKQPTAGIGQQGNDH